MKSLKAVEHLVSTSGEGRQGYILDGTIRVLPKCGLGSVEDWGGSVQIAGDPVFC